MSRQSVIRQQVAQHGLYGCWVGGEGDYKGEIEKQPYGLPQPRAPGGLGSHTGLRRTWPLPSEMRVCLQASPQ